MDQPAPHPLTNTGKTRCQVLLKREDGAPPQEVTVLADSLFEAALKAQKQYSTVWGFDHDAPILVRCRDKEYRVTPERLLAWQHGMSNAQTRAFLEQRALLDTARLPD